MSEANLIALDFDQHEMQCPHCKQQTVHHSPGKKFDNGAPGVPARQADCQHPNRKSRPPRAII
jgi:hypothetical protein